MISSFLQFPHVGTKVCREDEVEKEKGQDALLTSKLGTLNKCLYKSSSDFALCHPLQNMG
jgi:hypothetical protein